MVRRYARISAWVSQRVYVLLGILFVILSVTLTAHAMLTVSNTGLSGDSDVTVDAAGALSIGTASSTGITIGKAGVPVIVPGVLNVTHALSLGAASTTAGQLIFNNPSNGFTTLLQSSPSQASSLSLTLPSSAGTAGQALLTDGNGSLYFGAGGGSSQWLNGANGLISYNGGNVSVGNTVSANGGIISPNVPSLYVGLVATRGQVRSNYLASNTWWLQRSMHIARTSLPALGLKVIWGNYYVDPTAIGPEIAPPGGTVYKAAIEYPAGTIVPCLFSGSSTVTISNAGDAITDWCGPAIPLGATFWVRSLQTNPSGTIFTQGASYHFSATADGCMFGSGTPTDNVYSGTIFSGACVGTYASFPTAIIGNTARPSVCIVGDSRAFGYYDSITGASADVGEVPRIIGPFYAYSNFSVPSVTAANVLTHFTNRLRIMAYCSHAIDALGINDLTTGATASALATSRTSLAALFAIPTIGTTLPPKTSSTDGWATISNQTIVYDTAAFNALVRAGISGEMSIFDVAFALDPLGLSKWPVSVIPGSTSGSAGYATSDGLHESPAANQQIARSSVINATIIVR